jgi:hypothetical protein
VTTFAAVLYLAAVIVLLVAWVLAVAGRPGYGLCVLAAALALLAYALPAMQAGFK